MAQIVCSDKPVLSDKSTQAAHAEPFSDSEAGYNSLTIYAAITLDGINLRSTRYIICSVLMPVLL